MFALNLADLSKYTADPGLKILLNGVASASSETIEAEPGRIDGRAVLLNCDDERGQAIISTIRKKYKRHELRCYSSKTGRGGWQRL